VVAQVAVALEVAEVGVVEEVAFAVAMLVAEVVVAQEVVLEVAAVVEVVIEPQLAQEVAELLLRALQ